MKKSAVCLITFRQPDFGAASFSLRMRRGLTRLPRRKPPGLRDHHGRRCRQARSRRPTTSSRRRRRWSATSCRRAPTDASRRARSTSRSPASCASNTPAPAALEVIADGSKVAVNDRRLKTQDTYFDRPDAAEVPAAGQDRPEVRHANPQRPEDAGRGDDPPRRPHDVRRDVTHPAHLRQGHATSCAPGRSATRRATRRWSRSTTSI